MISNVKHGIAFSNQVPSTCLLVVTVYSCSQGRMSSCGTLLLNPATLVFDEIASAVKEQMAQKDDASRLFKICNVNVTKCMARLKTLSIF